MKKYIVVQSRNIDNLKYKVNENMEEYGYIPVGTMTISENYCEDIMDGYVRVGVKRGRMFFQPMMIASTS